MIASVTLLVGSGIWALLFTHRLARLASTIEWLAVGGAAWLVALCWIPFLAARVAGMQNAGWLAPVIVVALLGVECAVGKAGRRRSLRRVPLFFRRLGTPANRWPTLAMAAFLAFHAWGHYWHCLREKNGAYLSAGAGWEDQSFHAALATSFSLGDNVTRLSYPHLPDWPLGYPFLPDFQAGWFHAAGMPLPLAFIVGNVLASAVFLLSAWRLSRAWLGARGRALMALLLWHLGGGFGLAFVFHEWSRSGSLWDALAMHDYANDWSLELHFHNLVTAIVWPMRVVLFGLAAACALTVLLRALLRRARTRLAAYTLAGGLAGALPLISAHGLVVLACVIPPLALMSKPGSRWKGWCAATLIGAVVAIPQLVWMRHQLGRSEPPFLRFKFGWMAGWGGAHPLLNLLHHWAWNTGIWISLGFAAWFFAGRAFRRETLGWWLIFLAGFLVVFQPYVFDNIKLFAAGALAAAAGCAWWLARAWQGGWLGRGFAVILFLLMTASGIQSIVSEAANPAVIVEAEAREFARKVAAATPRDALILTGPQLHHPVLILAGRRVVAANHSGLTLHGVPRMLDRTAEAGDIYRGKPDALARVRALDLKWIVIGPMERIEFPDLNEPFLRSISDQTLVSGPWELRKIHALP